MRALQVTSVLAAVLMLGSMGVAQQTNEQTRQEAQAEVKQQHDADKAQAKADKSAHKALKSKKVKKAARDQDKADRQADKATLPATPCH